MDDHYGMTICVAQNKVVNHLPNAISQHLIKCPYDLKGMYGCFLKPFLKIVFDNRDKVILVLSKNCSSFLNLALFFQKKKHVFYVIFALVIFQNKK